MTLSVLGGGLGVLGAALSIAAIRVASAPRPCWNPGPWLLGLGFSAAVGITAGLLPALKAARLDVIDALRFE